MDKLDTQPIGGPQSVTTAARASIDLGCPGVATFEVVTPTSSPQVKAYAATVSGEWKPVRCILRKADGTESVIDPDTASGVLSANDKVVVPLVGEVKASVIATTGSLTCNILGDSTPGALVWALSKVIDGITVTVTSNTEYADDGTGFTVGTSKVTAIGALADEASSDSVDEGDVGALRMTLDRHLRTIFPAGTPYFLVCDGTDELLVSSSARRLLYADIFHLNDAPCYAKLYDKATAPDENDTPVHAVCGPANATAALGGGSNKPLPPGGIGLTNGLGVRVVKGLANNSDTAVDASEVIVCLVYDTRAA